MTTLEERVIKLLKQHLEQIPELKKEEKLSGSPTFIEWENNISTVVRRTFEEGSEELKRLNGIHYAPQVFIAGEDDYEYDQECYIQGLDKAGAQLRSIITIIETMGLPN